MRSWVLAGAVAAMALAGSASAQKPTGEVEKVQGGFEFTEGPAVDAEGMLYFTDIPKERIHKLDADGKVTVFREKSGHANGLMYHPVKKELWACEMDGQVVAFGMDGVQRRVVAGEYAGKRFNAPNDLVIDSHGGAYFTDPSFRAPKPQPQDKLGVYYVAADSKVTRLVDDLPNPNGVILSPDEKTLYVIPSGQSEMMEYPVEGPGKIGKGKVFCRLAQLSQRAKDVGTGGGDGLTVDVKGNLYITSALGVQVFSPKGEGLGIIAFPEVPANVTFGGPQRKTLYATARTSLYAVPLDVAGHVFPGAPSK